jgi:hypothetical protein
MMQYALFTELVRPGMINPMHEANYPGYRRLPHPIVDEYIVFPINQPFSIRCAAVLVGNVVIAVRDFRKIEE